MLNTRVQPLIVYIFSIDCHRDIWASNVATHNRIRMFNLVFHTYTLLVWYLSFDFSSQKYSRFTRTLSNFSDLLRTINQIFTQTKPGIISLSLFLSVCLSFWLFVFPSSCLFVFFLPLSLFPMFLSLIWMQLATYFPWIYELRCTRWATTFIVCTTE